MSLKIVTPLVREFFLDKSDKKYGDGTSRTVARFFQATQGAIEIHDQVFSSTEKTYLQSGGVQVKGQHPQSYVNKMEVATTLAFCDLLDEKGNMLFEFENGKVKDEQKFYVAWASLFPDIADELHELCLLANPQWAPLGEKQSENS